MSFRELGVSEWLCEQLKAVGIIEPTEVQKNCLASIMKGDDVVACAKTGSGKTAAFLLPVLKRLGEEPMGLFALVLTPTRELAYQIGEQAQALGKAINLRAVIITGGQDIVEQGLRLEERPHLVISTPGRLADHLRSKPSSEFSLSTIKVLIMDEVDRLLEDNFGEDLAEIMSTIPPSGARQTLLFSATYSDTVAKAVEATALQRKASGLPPAFVWQASTPGDSSTGPATVATLEEYYVLTNAQYKDAFLIHIVDKFTEANKQSLVMIFINKCKWCYLLGLMFQALGFQAVLLHSGISQKERIASLNKFKANQVRILIGTDVMSRGLDIPTVDLVINHNVPLRTKDYVHRVGRTARAGKKGMAITIADQFEINLLRSVQKFINKELSKYEVNESEVAKIIAEVTMARRDAERKLDEIGFDEKRETLKAKKKILEASSRGEIPDQTTTSQTSRKKIKKDS